MIETFPTGIPPKLCGQIEALCGELLQAGGSNVSAIILYGGVARGRYCAGVSDVNLLLLLEDPSIRAIAKIAPVLHSYWRAIQVEPYIVGTVELARTVEDFPTRFWNIQRDHITLRGNDPFKSISISPRALCLRIEQELRNLSIRVRRRFVLTHDDSTAQARVLLGAVVPLAVSLTGLLQLRNRPTDAVFDEAASTFSLDHEVLAFLKQLRRQEPTTELPEGMFDRAVATLIATADVAVAEGAK